MNKRSLLALNCGSSSLKYALFDGDDVARERLRGEIDHIGSGGATDHDAAVASVLSILDQKGHAKPDGVAHRLVHGGPKHFAPQRVDDALLATLKKAIPFAPLHLPTELKTIEAVKKHFGDMPQVACFDTAFHRSMPEVAARYALPAKLFDDGIHRYGFHGLSYEFVVSALGEAARGRAILAHLGSGSSMVITRDGRSLDTTMGFTPSAGLIMGTRLGDIDPGLIVHLLEARGYDARSLERLVNHEAGLTALSGGTADMQKLLATRAQDPRAALAIDAFTYQARKWIGALAAVTGGIDALVFTGGIGQHSAPIREEICRGLEHLGIRIDPERNAQGGTNIERDPSSCKVHAIATNEEAVLARHAREVLSIG